MPTAERHPSTEPSALSLPTEPTGPTEPASPVGPVGPAGERPGPDPSVMREHYLHEGLAEEELADDPYRQFTRWFHEAGEAGVPEPNAMVLSTADAEGLPSARTVLLKGYDRRGFVFFTNYGSRKGTDLAANPNAALLFPWIVLARQVIVAGRVEKVGRDETAAYFRTRPHGSQLGAWASEQSSPLADRGVLEQRYADLAARYPEGEGVPVPPFWGGYRVVPRTVEFWQGRENRLHDRLRYVAEGAGWRVERLFP
ncbi:pyridoxine/pyridoxamine 5'-phosphate oxidase [Kitasatospora phosalacinea]|uniref:Pyridoxine/pyridoxamine 5'-phosphate oxidase n=2 Tax=Kitasatospora phosalacinea TaxID=2065 RepID=A0A9W6V2T2_9ACTN|nr:pyridoxine/pyridoxamine 5'-phosphate oxidase [Kitasatospora phosalacinea]